MVQRASGNQLAGLIKLMRPKQWIKNGFVLAPLIFTGEFLIPAAVAQSFFATFLFCVASAATYIVNDLRDIERDRRHPVKSKTRPLAAGLVSPRAALICLGVLWSILIIGWFLAPHVALVILGYLLLNLAYSFRLKHVPVVDIFCIASGFVLRVFAGAMALDVPVSSWTFITTLCLALYLASIKRRQELAHSGTESREVLGKYSLALVNRYAELSATGAVIFYSLFVMSARPALIITVPLVLFGLFRYWYVVEQEHAGESPTDVLASDIPLILTVIAWVGATIWALWPA